MDIRVSSPEGSASRTHRPRPTRSEQIHDLHSAASDIRSIQTVGGVERTGCFNLEVAPEQSAFPKYTSNHSQHRQLYSTLTSPPPSPLPSSRYISRQLTTAILLLFCLHPVPEQFRVACHWDWLGLT